VWAGTWQLIQIPMQVVGEGIGLCLQDGYLLDAAARFPFKVKTSTTGKIQNFKVNLYEPRHFCSTWSSKVKCGP
jgi:hypothetical protein